MKRRYGFGLANFDVVLYKKKETNSILDIVEKAYAAGVITQFGKSIIFGTGAGRGTWWQFANIEVKDITFTDARDYLSYYTNIYSTALRNQGKTKKKIHFYLSQLQEIKPVLKFMGLIDEFESAWEVVKEHDITNDLKAEWLENGKIEDWKNRSMRIDMPFIDREIEIMENVTKNILSPYSNYQILKVHGIDNPVDFIQGIFLEGLRGLTLGSVDLHRLSQGLPIVEYKKAA